MHNQSHRSGKDIYYENYGIFYDYQISQGLVLCDSTWGQILRNNVPLIVT